MFWLNPFCLCSLLTATLLFRSCAPTAVIPSAPPTQNPASSARAEKLDENIVAPSKPVVEADEVKLSSGTVNIIVASHGKLVAVTDSMLSSGIARTPGGIKLYQIDKTTICTVAGIYTTANPDGLTGFQFWIPQLMKDYTALIQYYGGAAPFVLKARQLQHKAMFRLNASINELLIKYPAYDLGPILSQPLELTLVGYDRDGLLRIADITLALRQTQAGARFIPITRPHSKYAPGCSVNAVADPITGEPFDKGFPDPTVRRIDERFFCEVAGLSETAERILYEPSNYESIPIIRKLNEANRTGKDMSSLELKELGVELEAQTAKAEENSTRYVGGKAQTAVLENGMVQESPELPPMPVVPSNPKTGNLLSRPKFSDSRFDCTAFQKPFEFRPNAEGVQMENDSFINCLDLKIDGLMLSKCRFENDYLIYSGEGSLFFAASNEVVNSTLELGPKVNIEDQAIQNVICGFSWKGVFYNGKQLHCPLK